MPSGTRTIKRRIKSVKNTRKITKAMELVAASKMRKAVASVLGTRPYADLAWQTVLSIGSKTDAELHPLLRKHKKIFRVLFVLITSDRGLAGGFNANMIRAVKAAMKAHEPGAKVHILTIGKRGADAMRKTGLPMVATFTNITDRPKFEDILPIGRFIVEEFSKGSYEKVVLAFTDFESAISQKPELMDFLPLGTPEQMSGLGTVGNNETMKELNNKSKGDYTFEPDARAVLDRLLPRLVETMLYQAVLESSASEHSARMMAMRSASDAAEEMIDSLTFTFNQVRQAGITQEIAEISSGKAALE